jgi:hypothetical protein
MAPVLWLRVIEVFTRARERDQTFAALKNGYPSGIDLGLSWQLLLNPMVVIESIFVISHALSVPLHKRSFTTRFWLHLSYEAILSTALPANFPAIISSQNLSRSSRVPFDKIGWTRPRAVKSSASSTSLSVPTTLPTIFNFLRHRTIGGAPARTVGSFGSPTAFAFSQPAPKSEYLER